MKLFNRAILTAAVCLGASLPAYAQSVDQYPTKSITIVVPFPPGGLTDLLGRHLASKLEASLGTTVIVDNRPGAGGTIASQRVAQTPGDGYTLVVGVTGTHAISYNLYKQPPYDPETDFSAISSIVRAPNVLVVRPDLPVNNLAEFIEYAKEHPGKVTYGSSGMGTALHLFGELFNVHAGTELLHVPYKGWAPTQTDLLGGRIDAVFASPADVVRYLDTGKLKFIAVTSAERFPTLPNVPTMVESGLKDFAVYSWQGLFAPKNTPKPIIDKLNAEVVKVFQIPEVRDAVISHGLVPVTSTPEEFSKFVSDQKAMWGQAVKRANIPLN